jgi:hypothetical protein
LYYAIALLPGDLVADGALAAMVVNVVGGVCLSLILYLVLRRKSPQKTPR